LNTTTPEATTATTTPEVTTTTTTTPEFTTTTTDGLCGGIVCPPGDICILDTCSDPFEIEWTTTQEGVEADGGWIIANQGLTVRFGIEDSEDCNGTNAQTQNGTATATINVGESYALTAEIVGIGELQDEGYELLIVSLDGNEIVIAYAEGGGLECQMGPVVFTELVPPPHCLDVGQHIFEVLFTTNDPFYHVNAFYELNLIFETSDCQLPSQPPPPVPETLCEEPEPNCQGILTAMALESNGNITQADNFVLQGVGNAILNSVCFYGLYFDLDSGPVNSLPTPTDDFRITYYEDDGDSPGTSIASYDIPTGLTVTGPSDTGLLVQDTGTIWSFTAQHPDVTVTAGDHYWIEIINFTDESVVWYWEASLDGDGMSNGSPQQVQNEIYDLAFCLNVPLAALG